MDLTDLRVIKGLLKKHQAFPSKRLGQNFLIRKSVLQKIVEAAILQPKDVVLEIGPGIGNLTQEIAKRTKKVIAVEKDPKLCKILKETLKDFKNIKVIQQDILKIFNSQFSIFNKFSIFNYKVVANLPYYIVAPVIRKFLETGKPPKEMVLMVQKEVAQRICASPPRMNLLAVSVQFYAEPKIISFVSKESFWPQPKVDAAIIKIIPRQPAPYPPHKNFVGGGAGFRERFFRIVKAGFSQPRKQLVNNLSKMLKLDKEKVGRWLLKNSILPSQRAETLNLENWISLANQVVNF